ncbi:hypothetical protein BKA61DRAFT_628255 [Leptodontidium sp. MPI-SDFR-AT-0119]|nr:hypothetical protein BKA61DRAFT_628255 [Leptodontidium sp. MPI-SDFR-AT-0119]
MASEDQKTGPGGHCSGPNPIPNVQKFVESLDADKKERDKTINEGLASGEIQDHIDQEVGISGTRKKVTDLISGREVEIEDVNKDFMKAVKNPQLSVPNANFEKETHAKTDGTQSGEEYRISQDITAPPDPLEPNTTSDIPIHGEKTKYSLSPYTTRTTILCAGVLIAIVVLGKFFGGALHGLVPLGFCMSSGIYLWMKDLVRRGRAKEWSTEKTRGEMACAAANLIPESVEWMNTFLDTLEDIMQASVPSIVENVRVAEINQGNNPFRVLSLRALPDGHVSEMKSEIHQQSEKKKDPQELAADEQGGDYYNLECSFAYHASPTGTSEKAKNIHMQLVFYLGIKGLFGVPLPIFVELQSLVGTVHLRLQMSSEAPFLKAVTFTLMGMPKIQASCVPLIDAGINILNLPLISKFVNYAIGRSLILLVFEGKRQVLVAFKCFRMLWNYLRTFKQALDPDNGSAGAAANENVAPKSMTLDMTKLLKGDDIQKDIEALGILWIRIHKATGKMYPQISKLWGMHQDKVIPGELHWEVGYFSKPQFRPALRSHGKDINLPDELKDKRELQDEKESLDTAAKEAVVKSQGKRKGREFEPAQPSGENKDEEHKKLLSGYCTVLFNDELVYRTRTKDVCSKPIFNAGTERSGIITVTVRDQRTRQLSDALQTSSQVTRWYPLDGGIGIGRIRISLLFRSVEHDCHQSSWAGIILATGFNTNSKLKMRTGGGSDKIGRARCKKTEEGDGVYWDMVDEEGNNRVRLPVKYRYRSPVIFELHSASKRGADAHAVVWLHHLEDNKEEDISIPIWKTDKGMRLTQNYITDENLKTIPDIRIAEVGRLQFRGRFKAGTDQDHSAFTWEACNSDGVREPVVTKELPQKVQELHDKSLVQGRDILSQADEGEKQKWMSKEGTDWSGAFGQDPARQMDQKEDDASSDSETDGSDLGLHDATNHEDFKDAETDTEQKLNSEVQGDVETTANIVPSSNGESKTKDPVEQIKNYKEDKQELHRKQKGIMQWRPARNLQFARNEAKCPGRKPDVESEF